jgi:hypothetical protein
MAFVVKINGTNRSLDVDGDTPLLWVPRDAWHDRHEVRLQLTTDTIVVNKVPSL